MDNLIAEAQSLATVGEDQFEASLAKLVSDMQAFKAGLGSAPTVTTVTGVVNFSDGSNQPFPVSQE